MQITHPKASSAKVLKKMISRKVFYEKVKPCFLKGNMCPLENRTFTRQILSKKMVYEKIKIKSNNTMYTYFRLCIQILIFLIAVSH